MAESLIYDSVVEESVDGTTRRVYSCDMPRKRSVKAASERCGPQPVDDEHLRETICALAVERRENEALRKYVDWLTKRVQTLEMQLTEDKKC